MEEPKRIASLAQVRGWDDTILTECYVLGLGFSGCTALSELSVPPGTAVYVDFTFLNSSGEPEAETVSASVAACDGRQGGWRIGLAFTEDLARKEGSRLAAFIRREEMEGRVGPMSPTREAGAGSA
ncbi:MAG: hypothetical protein OEY97_12720 [Nitrospirota bacterium]|nr:hypothetical protein [Nitrospirota bacterium]